MMNSTKAAMFYFNVTLEYQTQATAKNCSVGPIVMEKQHSIRTFIHGKLNKNKYTQPKEDLKHKKNTFWPAMCKGSSKNNTVIKCIIILTFWVKMSRIKNIWIHFWDPWLNLKYHKIWFFTQTLCRWQPYKTKLLEYFGKMNRTIFCQEVGLKNVN
jgi:hypothetical protein